MELQEQGEEKLFVQVQFGKVEPAICCLSSGPKMKNTRSTEQFNQFKVNRGTDMKGHGNNDGRQGKDSNTVCLKHIIGDNFMSFTFLHVQVFIFVSSIYLG